MRLAEAMIGGGQLTVCRIVNHTAAAFGGRQVQFTDNVSVTKDDSLRAWRVQFALIEKLLVPERVEQRSATHPVNQQAAPGQPVVGADGQPGPPAELSGFEKVLKTVDDWLAPKP
jgi:hypothetical protein